MPPEKIRKPLKTFRFSVVFRGIDSQLKKIRMNTMSFINSDLNTEAQALEVTFSGTTKSYHSLFQQSIKNLSDCEIKFV